MITRATYKIENQVFYIHSDGYLEGAAVYFWEMLHSDSCRGGMAEAFLRANGSASFTESHEHVDDTEFRYTLKGNDLCAMARIDFSDRWESVFNGKIWDFINQHPVQIGNFEPVIYYKHSFTEHVSVLSLKQVYERFDSQLKQAQKWLESGHISNGCGALDDAEKMCQLLKVGLDENNYEFDNRAFYNSIIETATKLIDTYQDTCRLKYGHSVESWNGIRESNTQNIH